MLSVRNPPFNLLIWSLLQLFLFLAVQTALSVAYAVLGHKIGAPIALLNWFALSAAVGFGLWARFQPEWSHLALLQALSTFYVGTLSVSAGAVIEGAVTGAVLARAGGGALVLFLCGMLGYALAHALYRWRSA